MSSKQAAVGGYWVENFFIEKIFPLTIIFACFFSTHLVYCPRPCLSGRHCGIWVGKENSIRMDDFSDFLFASRKG